MVRRAAAAHARNRGVAAPESGYAPPRARWHPCHLAPAIAARFRAQEQVDTERGEPSSRHAARDSNTLHDLEKPVRGPARAGQAERAGVHAIVNSSGGNARPWRPELRADDRTRELTRPQKRWRTVLRSRGQCASDATARIFHPAVDTRQDPPIDIRPNDYDTGVTNATSR